MKIINPIGEITKYNAQIIFNLFDFDSFDFEMFIDYKAKQIDLIKIDNCINKKEKWTILKANKKVIKYLLEHYTRRYKAKSN